MASSNSRARPITQSKLQLLAGTLQNINRMTIKNLIVLLLVSVFFASNVIAQPSELIQLGYSHLYI